MLKFHAIFPLSLKIHKRGTIMAHMQAWRGKVREIRKLVQEEQIREQVITDNNNKWDTALTTILNLGDPLSDAPLADIFGRQAAGDASSATSPSYLSLAAKMARDLLEITAARLDPTNETAPYEAQYIGQRISGFNEWNRYDAGISDSLSEIKAIAKDFLRDPRHMHASEEKKAQRKQSISLKTGEALTQYMQDNPWAISMLKEMSEENGGLSVHQARVEYQWAQGDAERILKGVVEDVNEIYHASAQPELINITRIGQHIINPEHPAHTLIKATPSLEDKSLVEYMQTNPWAVRVLKKLAAAHGMAEETMANDHDLKCSQIRDMVETVNKIYSAGHQRQPIEIQEGKIYYTNRWHSAWNVIRATADPDTQSAPSAAATPVSSTTVRTPRV
jgi:hypothetical protein